MSTPRTWFIFGDSHVGTFSIAAEQRLIHRPCRFAIVSGATATGMRNPNSLTHALPKFSAALLPPEQSTDPVIQMGEVDCGFVIWWRSKKYGESIDQQLEEAIISQMAFVDGLLYAGYSRVVLTGATLPTIQDGTDWGEIANLRREVEATLAERTSLTLAFNARLKQEAHRRSQPFIDISGELLDNDTGVIADRFRHPNPADHHLNPETAAPLWAAALNELGRIDIQDSQAT